ncbi:protransforming growth factor alpha isoform X1 [Mobula birostris]|uniref:protransforming growth factor alpha isoform X1 n=1 Tax=Mobula birostris TaxID=1983395 RepID=UPI003B27C92E
MKTSKPNPRTLQSQSVHTTTSMMWSAIGEVIIILSGAVFFVCHALENATLTVIPEFKEDRVLSSSGSTENYYCVTHTKCWRNSQAWQHLEKSPPVAAAVRSHFDDCPDTHRQFCFHGTCRFLVQESAPACVCHPGFIGTRCEHADILAVVAVRQKQQAITTLVVVSVVVSVLLVAACVLLQGVRIDGISVASSDLCISTAIDNNGLPAFMFLPDPGSSHPRQRDHIC